MTPAERCFKVDKLKIHFITEWLPEKEDDRKCTFCVIETARHEFYSGVAVSHPKEFPNTKTGWKISLKRACHAMTWVMGELYYKHFWHNIRLQLRNEKFLEEQEKAKKALEESNGQDAS